MRRRRSSRFPKCINKKKQARRLSRWSSKRKIKQTKRKLKAQRQKKTAKYNKENKRFPPRNMKPHRSINWRTVRKSQKKKHRKR